MKISIKGVCRCLATVCLLLAIENVSGIAQGVPFTVSVEKPDRTLPPGGFTTFEIFVHNTSSASINIRVERTKNSLPDTSWHGSICSELVCYGEPVSLLPPVTVGSGDSTFFKMHILAGQQIGAEAKVTLRFDTGNGSGSVQLAFSVKVVVPPKPIFYLYVPETEKTASVGEVTNFLVGALNVSDTSLDIVMRRIENNFPDTSWESWFCDNDSCYSPQISEAPRTTVSAGHGVYYTLKVKSGITNTTPAKITLRFDVGQATDPIYQQFIVHPAASGVINDPIRNTVGNPYPNPASAFTTIDIPELRSQILEMYICNAHGRIVFDLTKHARLFAPFGGRLYLDVSALAQGEYFCRFVMKDQTVMRSIVVAR